MPKAKTQASYTTANGVEIFVLPSSKSANDFIVKYREPGKTLRTPKHVHLTVDLLQKRTGNAELTKQLLDHILKNVIPLLKPATSFPPKIQVFTLEHLAHFSELNDYGDYSLDFLLITLELILIQEITNYAGGTMHTKGLEKLRNGADTFSVLSAAA
jgi:hypothetical protein